MVSGLVRAQIASVTGTFLTERATVSREVTAAGPFGEQVRHWQVVMADVPCRVIRTPFDRNQKVEDAANRESAPETYSVILPLDAGLVQATDQLTVNGRELRVVQVQTALTDAVFQRVQAVARE